MNVFAISFSIKFDTTYGERYDSLMTAIRKCNRLWEETTSFCLVGTNESLTMLEHRLYMTEFSPSRDKLLIIDVGFDRAVARGNISYPATLKGLLPNCDVKQANALAGY